MLIERQKNDGVQMLFNELYSRFPLADVHKDVNWCSVSWIEDVSHVSYNLENPDDDH